MLSYSVSLSFCRLASNAQFQICLESYNCGSKNLWKLFFPSCLWIFIIKDGKWQSASIHILDYAYFTIREKQRQIYCHLENIENIIELNPHLYYSIRRTVCRNLSKVEGEYEASAYKYPLLFSTYFWCDFHSQRSKCRKTNAEYDTSIYAMNALSKIIRWDLLYSITQNRKVKKIRKTISHTSLSCRR